MARQDVALAAERRSSADRSQDPAGTARPRAIRECTAEDSARDAELVVGRILSWVEHSGGEGMRGAIDGDGVR